MTTMPPTSRTNAGGYRARAALLQGLVYCGCGHKMVVQYKGGNQYLCNALRWQAQDPVCQRLRADPWTSRW